MNTQEFRRGKLEQWREIQAQYERNVQIAQSHGVTRAAARETVGCLMRDSVAAFLGSLRPGVAAIRSLRARAPHDYRARPELLLHLDPAVLDVIASVNPHAVSARTLMSAGAETDADVDKVEEAVAKFGPADPIGRWGPVQSYSGRTVGEPCIGTLGVCDDYDVDAWMTEAKSWTSYAKKLREENVVSQFGADVQGWPATARHGEIAYQRARELIGGNTGYLDGDKVLTFVAAQKYAKVAMELYTRAIEAAAFDGHTWDTGDFAKDTITDSYDTPPVVNPPPSIPLTVWFGLGAGVATAVMVGVGISRVRGMQKTQGAPVTEPSGPAREVSPATPVAGAHWDAAAGGGPRRRSGGVSQSSSFDGILAASEARARASMPEILACAARLIRIESGGKLTGLETKTSKPGVGSTSRPALVVQRVNGSPEFPSLVYPVLETIADGFDASATLGLVELDPIGVTLTVGELPRAHRFILEATLHGAIRNAHSSVVSRWLRPATDGIGPGRGAWDGVTSDAVPILRNSTCAKCPFVLGSNLDCDVCRGWILSLKVPGEPWSSERLSAKLKQTCPEEAVPGMALAALAESTRPPLTPEYFREFAANFARRSRGWTEGYLNHCRESVEYQLVQPDFPLLMKRG